MNNIYDVIFIGFGPSTIFSLLKYPQKNCLVLEKGKSLRDRDSKEVLFGSGGAGAWSDSKLVANPLVGGDLTDISPMGVDYFYSLADQILNWYNHFNRNYYSQTSFEKFDWIPEDSYEIFSNKLELLKSKVCHIGTDRSKDIFLNMEEYIRTKHEIQFGQEVHTVVPFWIDHGYGKREQLFKIIAKTEGLANRVEFITKKVVIGVGKRSNLVEDLKKQLNLKSKNNLVQLGARVECSNIYLKELVEKFYDFKIVMNTKLGRWRTFCVNSGSAHVALEKCKDFVSVNGHAFSDERVPNTGLINFGLMGELNLGLGRKEQIELMKKTNAGTGKLLAQNINDFLNNQISNSLNYNTTLSKNQYRFDHLGKYYPQGV